MDRSQNMKFKKLEKDAYSEKPLTQIKTCKVKLHILWIYMRNLMYKIIDF